MRALVFEITGTSAGPFRGAMSLPTTCTLCLYQERHARSRHRSAGPTAGSLRGALVIESASTTARGYVELRLSPRHARSAYGWRKCALSSSRAQAAGPPHASMLQCFEAPARRLRLQERLAHSRHRERRHDSQAFTRSYVFAHEMHTLPTAGEACTLSSSRAPLRPDRRAFTRTYAFAHDMHTLSTTGEA